MAKQLDPGVLAAMKARLSDRDVEKLAEYERPSRMGLRDAALEARKARDLQHAKAEQGCRSMIFWIRNTLPMPSERRAELVDKVRELQAAWDAAIEGGGP